ncbi:SAM-dependent methyltransferase [Vibrio metschnikovii]|nr:SAM-dependent methyltransferase [Vibrio metschnikovii]
MVHDWDNLAKNWENNTTNTKFVQQVFQQLKTLTSLDGKHILDYGLWDGFLKSDDVTFGENYRRTGWLRIDD